MSIWKKTLSTDVLKTMNVHAKNTMVDHVGIKYTAFGQNWLEATMPVDDRTVQPFRLLHGGASVVLAETLGSYASFLASEEGKYSVGVDVSATHLRSVKSGSNVTGRATALRLGRRIHVWDIRIHETGKESDGPTCVSRLSVMINDIPKKVESR
ncbi:hotdog fold thioesterase [archaeon]|nr:MAG: hotdog fold thioesterase [archaeon]